MNHSQNLVFVLMAFLVMITGCTGSDDTKRDTGGAPGISEHGSMRMSVSSAVNGSTLPAIYTCSGPGQVPAIFWKDQPDAAQSMVLIMDDPDAPKRTFTHWIVYNLSPDAGGIPPNQLPVSEHAGTGLQGINSMKTRGYAPPCPPGTGVHRYIFTLYALDTLIYPDDSDRSHIDSAIQGHILDQARIVTFFGQK